MPLLPMYLLLTEMSCFYRVNWGFCWILLGNSSPALSYPISACRCRSFECEPSVCVSHWSLWSWSIMYVLVAPFSIHFRKYSLNCFYSHRPELHGFFFTTLSSYSDDASSFNIESLFAILSLTRIISTVQQHS